MKIFTEKQFNHFLKEYAEKIEEKSYKRGYDAGQKEGYESGYEKGLMADKKGVVFSKFGVYAFEDGVTKQITVNKGD